MVARHPLDSDDTIHIRSENSITTNNSNNNNTNTNTDDDDEDTIALWKPPALSAFVVGLDLDDSSPSRDASNSPNDNSLLRENSESPPTPSTKFCEDFLHHHQQEQQEQEPHSLFLTQEATPLKCLSTTNATTTNTTTTTNENHATATTTTTADVNTHHLEDRIADLEFKLATLSRLWQAQESSSNSFAHSRSNLAQRRGSLRNGRQGSSRSGGGVTLSPLHSTLPPLPHTYRIREPSATSIRTEHAVPADDDVLLGYDDDDDDLSYSKPYLESPGPPLLKRRRGKQRRTLSFALLYGEGLDSIHQTSSSPDPMGLSSDNDSNFDMLHTPMILSSEEEEEGNDNAHQPTPPPPPQQPTPQQQQQQQPHSSPNSTTTSALHNSNGNVLKPRPTRRRPLQPRLQEEETLNSVTGDLEPPPPPPPQSPPAVTLEEHQRPSTATTTNNHALASTTLEWPVTLQAPSALLDAPATPPMETAAPLLSPSNHSTIPILEDPSSRVRNKWLDYLNSVQEATDDSVESQMAEFIQVPQKVEALQSFGFMICCDSFLYVLVILPIRFIWSCLLLSIYALVPNSKSRPRSNSNTMTQQPFIPKPYRFHRRHMYQLIQVGIIYTIYRHVLCPISIGKLYHWIRGQEMIKLYVLVAMVEVFDRLMCSLGQDCLDSMYWNTTRQPRTRRMITSVLVVWVYATMHTLILFVHVATLNVAMNSSDQALLTLLISGNFAEIKSTVFKKYNKPHLFKVTASDICERFKLALFMGLVLILNLCQGGGMDQGMVTEYTTMCGFVWCAELLSDWIKHAFVTKSNFIKSSVYSEFGLLLAGDVTGFGHEGVNMDHSHAVVKRLGFPQIPLVCVMARYITEALRYFQQASYDSTALQVQQQEKLPALDLRKIAQYRMILWGIGIWLTLLLIKIALGSYLQRRCRNKLLSAPELPVTASSKKKKKKE